uniref:zona pellucida sperm-binding protein 3 n=1 Tax=Epinephelus lanceolatus TaxID=310571 RepID=UPI001446146F|nr:zona pellucida sperm-binding protein 3 [Epinephelus lanceolatus]
MKTKWHLYILWSVLSLGLLSCAVDTYDSPFSRRKKVFKLGTPKSKPIKQSPTGDRKSSQRLHASISPLSHLGARSLRPGDHETKIQSDFAYLQDVSVTCSTSDFVVRVKPAFYGLGADAEELKLGSSCKSNGVLRPYGDLLFMYPLTACDVVRGAPRGYLLYKFVLHYEPSPKRFPSRAHRINVDIECRYPRNNHVYQLTVQPTWETAVVRKRLKGSPNDFQMELMDDSWSTPAQSQVYQLGKTINFQVFAPHLPTGGKLYINTCYATPSSGFKSSLKYSIIDNFGCMLDSKRDPGASQFISQTDKTLRFSLKAFQFTSDPDTEVSIHCRLFVTSEDPGPAHKSCTYRGNRWTALTGDDSICECCDSQCVTSKNQRAMMEGSVSSGSLLVSDQPYAAEDSFLPVSMSSQGEATIYHYIDELHSDENLRESEDVVQYNDEEDYADEEEEAFEEDEDEEESGAIFGVIPEPDFDELVEQDEKESVVKVSNEFEEDGSGYVGEEEEGSEGREDEIHLNQKEAEVLRHWVQVEQMLPTQVGPQRELQLLVPGGEEENGKRRGRGEEDDRMKAAEVEWKDDEGLADLVEDGEVTWYFTWR